MTDKTLTVILAFIIGWALFFAGGIVGQGVTRNDAVAHGHGEFRAEQSKYGVVYKFYWK